ncbi:alpha/beta hydrolase, partial [Kitasatospora sp. NPDC058965]|uniref:alpha/beta hydrolase n=1 Tax=Kitasatospora sp. NPDC058965 TaxID=3346682 RepID=UPI0036B981B5
MPHHPQLRSVCEQRAAAGTPPLYTLTLAQARAADLAELQAAGGSPEPVHQVQEFTIRGPAGPLPLRLYRPTAEPDLPVLLYLFGGGWTLGCLDTADAICRRLANEAGCAVAGVGYRLAPEHRFPAALLDCRAALDWLAAQATALGLAADRLAVGGDSAGGNLAAALTLLCRERGGPALRHQLLVYPNTDHGADTPSRHEARDPLLFNRWSVDWYWGHYLASAADGADPLASPLRAASLAGLPPATVITAEYDPLRDEGEAYAHRLAEAGVPVELRRYDGMAHGFFAMAGVFDDGAQAQRYAAGRVRAAL